MGGEGVSCEFRDKSARANRCRCTISIVDGKENKYLTLKVKVKLVIRNGVIRWQGSICKKHYTFVYELLPLPKYYHLKFLPRKFR